MLFWEQKPDLEMEKINGMKQIMKKHRKTTVVVYK